MIKKRKLCKLANIGYNLLKVGACIAICFDAMCFGNIILNRSGDKRFYKSLFYQDAKLETGGNEILVILHDFSDEEAYIVKQSIREIDYLSANLNYVFADEQYIETDQVLNIYNNCDLSNISAAGVCVSRFDQMTASIKYPLTIKLERGLVNMVDEYDNNVTLLSAVTTHEVMHTLGFNDLRTDKWLGKSIMYWNIDDSSDNGVNKLTESDKQAIIDKYGPSTEEIEKE